ncbi:hypothetical protein O181_030249 [Austropuccinia psidii MF-1]|uniref:Uncharacterized protein n=1 Tax=Austropuccinia psidii MF-1 TaxID=1389203 RepID=A0A9Q3CTQ2_9BASI|nr:hypothetical protein [Austropuccinia psidii MF-1]
MIEEHSGEAQPSKIRKNKDSHPSFKDFLKSTLKLDRRRNPETCEGKPKATVVELPKYAQRTVDQFCETHGFANPMIPSEDLINPPMKNESTRKQQAFWNRFKKKKRCHQARLFVHDELR